MDYDPDDLSLDDLYDDEAFFRTCGKCGTRTAPRWSEMGQPRGGPPVRLAQSGRL